MIGEQNGQGPPDEAERRQPKQACHAKKVEQWAADGDGEGKSKEQNPDHFSDQPGGVGGINRIKEMCLQIAVDISTNSKRHSRRRQRDDTQDEELWFVVLRMSVNVGRRVHAKEHSY